MNTCVSFNLISLPRINLKSAFGTVLLFSLFCTLGLVLVYVFQIVNVAQESNQVIAYQEEIEEIDKQNKELEVDIFQSYSLSDIEMLVQKLGYEELGRVNYVRILGSTAIAK